MMALLLGPWIKVLLLLLLLVVALIRAGSSADHHHDGDLSTVSQFVRIVPRVLAKYDRPISIVDLDFCPALSSSRRVNRYASSEVL